MKIISKTAATVFALIAMGSPLAGQAAANTEGVRRAALDYIEGFYEGDTAKLVRSVSPSVRKYGYWIPKDSTRYAGEPMVWSEFLSYARGIKARGTPAPVTAPKEVVIFEVLDQTASVKVTAWWGSDYLLLAKENDKWVIQMVLWQTPPKKS